MLEQIGVGIDLYRMYRLTTIWKEFPDTQSIVWDYVSEAHNHSIAQRAKENSNMAFRKAITAEAIVKMEEAMKTNTDPVSKGQGISIRDNLLVDIRSCDPPLVKGTAYFLVNDIKAQKAKKDMGSLTASQFNAWKEIMRSQLIELGATDRKPKKAAKKAAKETVKKEASEVRRFTVEVPTKRRRKSSAKKAPAKTLAEKATRIKATPEVNVASAPAC